MKRIIIWYYTSQRSVQKKISVENLAGILEDVAFVLRSKVLKKRPRVRVIEPSWVRKHQTPQFEIGESMGVMNPILKLHRNQREKQYTTGIMVYAWIHETHQLPFCLELADLLWWERHQSEIPEMFNDLMIYAWKSVFFLKDDADDIPYVPYLWRDPQNTSGVFTVKWSRIDDGLNKNAAVCLNADYLTDTTIQYLANIE